jgi:hypothetical protein
MHKAVAVILLITVFLPFSAEADEQPVSFIRPNYGVSVGLGVDSLAFVSSVYGGVGLMWGHNIYFPTNFSAGLLMLTNGGAFYYGLRAKVSQTLAGLVVFGVNFDLYTKTQYHAPVKTLNPFIGVTVFDTVSATVHFNIDIDNHPLLSNLNFELTFDVGAYLFLINERRLSIAAPS